MKTLIIILLSAALVIGAGMLVSRALEDGSPDTEPDPDDTPEQTTVDVYFYDESEDQDDTGNIMCSSEAVLPVERDVDTEAYEEDPIRTVLGEVLRGTTAEEREDGFSSEFPAENLSIEDTNVSEGVAAVTFDDPDLFTSGGSCRVGLLYSQIEKTILSIDEIEEVNILPETLFQP